MKKKILSAILAMTMVMGLSISSFAAPITTMDGASSGTTLTGTSTTNLPIISVTVPTSIALTVNPYKLDYETSPAVAADPGNGIEAQDAQFDNAQIISALQVISSESNVPIAVNIAEFKAAPTVDGSIAIVAASAAKATAKSAYITLTIGKDITSTDAAVKKLNKTVIAKTTGASLASAYTIPKCEKNEAGTAYVANTCNFQIGGDVNPNPTKKNEGGATVADNWKTTDTIKVDLKFTFTPQIVPAS